MNAETFSSVQIVSCHDAGSKLLQSMGTQMFTTRSERHPIEEMGIFLASKPPQPSNPSPTRRWEAQWLWPLCTFPQHLWASRQWMLWSSLAGSSFCGSACGMHALRSLWNWRSCYWSGTGAANANCCWNGVPYCHMICGWTRNYLFEITYFLDSEPMWCCFMFSFFICRSTSIGSSSA